MTHYQEIQVLPEEMTGVPVLISLLFGRLHVALVQLQITNIGISFPEVGRTLGSILRLHGSQASLLQLDELPWLGSLTGYVCKMDVLPVPEKLQGYRIVSRRQIKSSPERLRRRFATRHNLSPEEVEKLIPDSIARVTALPFIQVKSSSTNQRFRLFVEHGPLLEQAYPGRFSSYGLSATATIPWF